LNILLHVPDNQITNNFLPQLWPFLLETLTSSEHQVTIVDGNVVHWDEEQIVQFVRGQKVDLVGMGETGQPQCADAVVMGEADQLWPQVVEDAARGQLKAVPTGAISAP